MRRAARPAPGAPRRTTARRGTPRTRARGRGIGSVTTVRDRTELAGVLDAEAVFSPRLLFSFYFGAVTCFVLGILGARRIFHARPGESVAIGFAALDSAAAAETLDKIKAEGIPVVAFNAGIDNWQAAGASAYFGQDERISGRAAGARLKQDGATKVICVIQDQGNVALESR